MEENTVEQPTQLEQTLEQQQASLRSVAEMKAKAYNELVAIHLQNLTRIMLSSNGVTELRKRQANKALVEAVLFALDFGVNVSNASIREKGTVLAKETNTLAGVLVQALDNRMLLLADNLRQQEELERIASQPTSDEQVGKNGDTAEG